MFFYRNDKAKSRETENALTGVNTVSRFLTIRNKNMRFLGKSDKFLRKSDFKLNKCLKKFTFSLLSCILNVDI